MPRLWVMTMNCVRSVELAERVGEASHVCLVEGGVDLVQHAERRRTDLEHREQERDGGQRPLAAREHVERLRLLAGRPCGDLDAGRREVRGIGQRELRRTRRRTAAGSGRRTPPRAPRTSCRNWVAISSSSSAISERVFVIAVAQVLVLRIERLEPLADGAVLVHRERVGRAELVEPPAQRPRGVPATEARRRRAPRPIVVRGCPARPRAGSPRGSPPRARLAVRQRRARRPPPVRQRPRPPPYVPRRCRHPPGWPCGHELVGIEPRRLGRGAAARPRPGPRAPRGAARAARRGPGVPPSHPRPRTVPGRRPCGAARGPPSRPARTRRAAPRSTRSSARSASSASRAACSRDVAAASSPATSSRSSAAARSRSASVTRSRSAPAIRASASATAASARARRPSASRRSRSWAATSFARPSRRVRSSATRDSHAPRASVSVAD